MNATNDDHPINDAVVEYFDAMKAGQVFDRAQYPELAEFFADTDDVARWTMPLRDTAMRLKTASDSSQTIDFQPRNVAKRIASFGAYEILEELGRGGMGIVYKARHLKLQRLIALKMIVTGQHGGAERATRFQAEARAVARLQHPNIVQIYEIGEHEGVPYFSMEYADGVCLAARLKRSPPSDMEAARLVELLARTVHYAHGRGIVHRDLKPANILLTSDGIPKIADFGLAKFLHEDVGATTDGTLLGTPSYMAPEQAAGKVREIGPATDVYSLGAILYEMLTGRPPFRGENIRTTLRSVEEDPPESPRLFNPRVDPALESICLKCLEKNQADRYRTAEALAEDLAAFQHGESLRHASTGSTRIWLNAVLRESRYTEVMTLWSRVWMGMAVVYFLVCFAKSFLLWSDVRDHRPYFAVWGFGMATTVLLMAWYRLRNGPRLSGIEKQLGQIWSSFWVGVFLTAWMYQRSGGPIENLLPILITEAAVAFMAMAAILGGSFYLMAAACLATAILEAFWPEVGPIISAVIGSPALFWLGWKYSGRIPAP